MFVDRVQLTSFGGRSIQDTLSPNRWQDYMPVFPTPALQGREQLRLYDNIKLQKNSYINIGKTHNISISILETLNQIGLTTIPRVDISSFAIIASRLSVNIEVPPQRLQNLLRIERTVQAATPANNEDAIGLQKEDKAAQSTVHTSLKDETQITKDTKDQRRAVQIDLLKKPTSQPDQGHVAKDTIDCRREEKVNQPEEHPSYLKQVDTTKRSGHKGVKEVVQNEEHTSQIDQIRTSNNTKDSQKGKVPLLQEHTSQLNQIRSAECRKSEELIALIKRVIHVIPGPVIQVYKFNWTRLSELVKFFDGTLWPVEKILDRPKELEMGETLTALRNYRNMLTRKS